MSIVDAEASAGFVVAIAVDVDWLGDEFPARDGFSVHAERLGISIAIRTTGVINFIRIFTFGSPCILRLLYFSCVRSFRLKWDYYNHAIVFINDSVLISWDIIVNEYS